MPMSDDGAEKNGPEELRRKRSLPLPPEPSPRSGRVTVPSASARRRRAGLLLMSALSVLVLFASGTSWALTGWMSGSLNRFDVFGGLSEEGRPEPTGGLTFLVIGSDSRDGSNREDEEELSLGSTPGQRSDTMMLVRLNHERDRVTVVGIPRDLWVDIPGQGADKINAAYAYGGPQLSVRTVESLTGVRIDHYVEVDFHGFVDVVDALGGIEVCLPEPINDPKAHLDMDAGTHQVDGTEALAFARTRATSQGDLDRIDRQQQVLSAMLDKALSTETLSNPAKLTNFLDSSLSSVTVDQGLDTRTINELAYQMRDLDMEAVDFTQTPIADMEHWTERGDVALLWDEPAARELFARIQADKPISGSEESSAGSTPDPGHIRVRVFNGIGTPGLGSQLDDALRTAGFQVTAPASNWSSSDVAESQVRHGPGNEAAAEYMAGMIPGSEIMEDATLGDELQIVVGFNYRTFEVPESGSGNGNGAPEGDPSPEESSSPHVSTARDNVCG